MLPRQLRKIAQQILHRELQPDSRSRITSRDEFLEQSVFSDKVFLDVAPDDL
jgi:hypothetical protein